MTFPEALHPTTLTCLHVEGLKNLKALNGKGFQHLTCLEELRIIDCKKLQCFPGEELPASLMSLHLTLLPKLEDLGKGLLHLISLKELSIEFCENLQCLSENGLPASLSSLTISDLANLEDIDKGFFQNLISLEELYIFCCENLKYSSLEKENGNGGLKNLISLKKLDISSSEKLPSLLEEGLPTSFISLSISWFQNLRDLNQMGFQHLNSLEKLEIWCCENLQSLPDAGLPLSLSYLGIYKCPLLEPRCQKGAGSD
ncbi:hypothetical protein TIFTF001_041692 [Ficus carica]|uniref:CC-NBS-LRR protein n=1 Tax=Ficus carica TaxID=3494 RepID=A0AA87ZHW5_FICCA|nr:hypothetical protein TIFTF001_041692 [Ficus carica]